MVAVSDNGLVDSLDDGESNDDESEKWVSSSRMDATVMSCNSFLLLSALFLLSVASISKSKGTKVPVGDLCINSTNRTMVIQFNKRRQIYS